MLKLTKNPRTLNFEQIKEKFNKLGCSVIEFPSKEIDPEFEKQFGEEILNEMFGYGHKFNDIKIIQIDISKLAKPKCSNTLHSDVFSKYFNLLESSDDTITHWNILETQLYTIEVNNDRELGTIYFLSKECNINWFGYIFIKE